jgi:hypothetical protein
MRPSAIVRPAGEPMTQQIRHTYDTRDDLHWT